MDVHEPLVGLHLLIHVLHRAERHPANVLNQSQPEHRSQRPEFSDGERGNLL